MNPIFTNTKLIIATAIALVIIGVGLYVASLRGAVDSRDEIIATQKTEILVDSKSDAAHELTSALKTDVLKVKGESNEVEINTTVGHHTISYD